MFGPAKITRLHVTGRDREHEPRIIELPGVIVAPLSLELAHVALHERGELVTLELLLRHLAASPTLVEAMCHEVDECLRDPNTRRPFRDPHR